MKTLNSILSLMLVSTFASADVEISNFSGYGADIKENNCTPFSRIPIAFKGVKIIAKDKVSLVLAADMPLGTRFFMLESDTFGDGTKMYSENAKLTVEKVEGDFTKGRFTFHSGLGPHCDMSLELTFFKQ